MNHLLPFLLANWPLSLLALVLIIALFFIEFSTRSMGINLISPQKATLLMNKKSCQIIDVRKKAAFEQSHISKSKHYELEQLKEDSSLQKYKTNPIVIVCESGMSAKKAGALLKSKGFEQVYALEGGIAQWRKENFPLIKSEV
ncbi:MAG: rhodanese [Gammaproteobacteria bacterium]|jgi:rhodanese-related sulfurtransferase|nr:rhodanese [Gammaproteobacteria bacterium]